MSAKKKPKTRVRSRGHASQGRAKGKKFELALCKAICMWWGDATDSKAKERSFRRSPGSGGEDPYNFPGDIVPSRLIGHKWPIVVEAKAQDTRFGDLIELLANEKAPLFEWVEQVRGDAKPVGRSWWLVVKRNLYPWLLFMDWRDWLKCCGQADALDGVRHYRLRAWDQDLDAAVVLFDEFLETVTPDELLSAISHTEKLR